jgi:hypothetical protein
VPDLAKHCKQASNNKILSTKLPAIPGSDDWAVTVLFYVAVHYVEAYFSLQNQHYQMHGSRETAIRRDPRINAIFTDYREMYEYSRTARYDCPEFDDAAIEAVQKRLKNIEGIILPLL